jgi:spermidine synthase
MSRPGLAFTLAFGVGFLSLSQEILFVRLVGFAFESTPESFAFVLVCFLLGVALGAHAGKRICARGAALAPAAGTVLMIAAAIDSILPQLALIALGPHAFASSFAAPSIGALILATAALKSVLFPIAHELGADATGPQVGRSISRVYACNIAGSALGPLVTGFLLLDAVGVEGAFLLIAAGTFALSIACFAATQRRRALGVGLAGITLIFMSVRLLPADLLRGIIAGQTPPETPAAMVIETRSGIIHTLRASAGGDHVYGGNVYDGRINTSLRVNSNGIARAYVLAALHPNPQRVLVIGLSSGAWTWVLSKFPGVRQIDVVEINPGYLDVIHAHPEVAGILADPRVRVHIDDGRRWLARNPDNRYDLIVMNTTFHWRAYATNLLSAESLSLIGRHLDAGGVMTFNTTDSPDALWTASRVFPFVRLYRNFAYASDHDFTRIDAESEQRVYGVADRGQPLLNPADAEDAAAVRSMLRVPFISPARVAEMTGRALEVITDDNMLTEYRYGRPNRLIPGFN